MDLTLSDEVVAIRETVQQFMSRTAVSAMNEYRAQNEFPRPLLKEMADLGLTGVLFPEAYGGSALGLTVQVVVMEEVARKDVSLGSILNNQTVTVPTAILHFGTDEQKERYLRDILECNVIGSFALTEPGAGSDVSGLSTRAVKTDGGYLINGAKMYITHSPVSDVMVVFARTSPEPHRGLSAFLVPSKATGVTIRQMKGRFLTELSPIGEVTFDDVFVPDGDLLGEEGQGFRVAMDALRLGRVIVSARAVGLARFALDKALEFARVRVAFGQEVGRFQMVQKEIADMVIELEAARLLLYSTAWQEDSGYNIGRSGSVCKVFCTEAAVRIIDRAISICGGAGFIDEMGLDAAFARARVSLTGEGSSNIQRVVIAEDALGFRSAGRHSDRPDFAL